MYGPGSNGVAATNPQLPRHTEVVVPVGVIPLPKGMDAKRVLVVTQAHTRARGAIREQPERFHLDPR